MSTDQTLLEEFQERFDQLAKVTKDEDPEVATQQVLGFLGESILQLADQIDGLREEMRETAG